jgi:hypothetical protein
MYRMWITTGVLLTAATVAQAGAQEYFSETSKDFGITPRGPVLTHYFPVKNTSNATVTIGQPRVSCGCVSASVVKNQLAPGESTAVVAFMDTRRIPQANVVKQVTVYVPFLSPVLEEVNLTVRSIARDDLVLTPDTLALGTVRKGQGGKATVKVTFYSDPNWRILEATSTGIYIKPTATEVGRQGTQVTYDVVAELDPACPVGNWTADVWLKTTGAGVDKLRIPVTVNVVAPIALNPEAVRFGDVTEGATTTQKVILQGSAPFKVMEVKGTDGQIKATPASKDARPVHILNLEFTPSAAGDLTRMLEVVTDSKEQPSVSIPVSAKVAGK